MIKVALSSVIVPPMRLGPYSDSVREGSTPGATAKTSGLWSPVASEKQVENFKGPGQARAEPKGEAALGKSHEFRWARSECELMRVGGACQPSLTCANGVADGRKSFPSKFFLRHRRGSLASEPSA